MGWRDLHHYRFKHDGCEMAPRDPLGREYFEDDALFPLDEFLCRPGDTLAYEYDFVNRWEHVLVLEEVMSDAPDRNPRCLGGERSCPPENCGGPSGYQDFLEALLNPYHPAHARALAWAGGRFDPEAFDLAAVNARLRSRLREPAAAALT
jgi:hypothetical protein